MADLNLRARRGRSGVSLSDCKTDRHFSHDSDTPMQHATTRKPLRQRGRPRGSYHDHRAPMTPTRTSRRGRPSRARTKITVHGVGTNCVASTRSATLSLELSARDPQEFELQGSSTSDSLLDLAWIARLGAVRSCREVLHRRDLNSAGLNHDAMSSVCRCFTWPSNRT
jgi:hypothetical protein